MNCPRCGSDCRTQSTLCASCGFHQDDVDQRLGTHAVVINRLVDTQHLLSLRDSARLEAQLDEFERRFPQVFCTIFLGVLPQGVSAGEGGFWLLNHGVRTCQGVTRQNQHGAALVIDPSTHEASLCFGYALEPAFAKGMARELLQKVSPALWHGDYANAVSKVVAGIDRQLRKYGSSGRRTPPTHATKPRSLFGFERVASPQSKTEAET